MMASFDQFKEVAREAFNGKFQHYQHLSETVHDSSSGCVTAFPSLCVFSQFERHYVAELFGHVRRFKRLAESSRTDTKRYPAAEYFQQFKDISKGVFHIPARQRRSGFEKFVLCDASDVRESLSRLGVGYTPEHCTYIRTDGKLRGTFSFDDDGLSFYTRDIIFVNERLPVSRAKFIRYAMIASSNLQLADLRADIGKIVGRKDFLDMCSFPADWVSSQVRAEFTSMYLTPHVRETAIGSFLDQHPEIICQSLGHTEFLTELELPWQDNDEQPSIRPDLLLRREDGCWDIGDLKTAEIFKRSLMTGGNKRPRFKDIVLEGCAQLARYREYFSSARNAEFARAEHGLRMNDPTLFLIVGNQDNLCPDDIRDCSTMLDPGIRVIEYDTIANLYASKQ